MVATLPIAVFAVPVVALSHSRTWAGTGASWRLGTPDALLVFRLQVGEPLRKEKANEAHILKCQLLRGGKGARRRVALLYLLPGRRGVKGGLQPHLVRDDWLGLDLLHADRLVEERALVQG